MVHTVEAEFAKVTGFPYYIETKGNDAFIGFAAEIDGNMKNLAQDGVKALFKEDPKDLYDNCSQLGEGQHNFVAKRDLFVGAGRSCFTPNTGMTCGVFATVIGRLYELSYGRLTGVHEQAFTDSDYNACYGAYIDGANEN